MNVYVLLISRLVPVILWISFCLVAARYLHDRFKAEGRPRSGQWLSGAVLAIGGATALLFLLRLGLLVGASADFADRNWRGVDHCYDEYESLGGTLTTPMSIEWAEALMHRRMFADAEQVLFRGGTRRGNGVALSREAVLRIGECYYYENRLDASTDAFNAASGTDRDFLRVYFLGLIAERHGRLAEAHRDYDSALRSAPGFFPAFYASVRLDLIAGSTDLAAQRLAAFARANPSAALNPAFAPLERAARGTGPVPGPGQFYVAAE